MGARGKVVLLTLTIDRKDPRYVAFRDLDARAPGMRQKVRPANGAILNAQGDAYAVEAEASVRYVSWAWNRFRTYLGRARWGEGRYGTRAYFRGLELQKSGVAHLHVLVRVHDAADFFALRALVRGPEDDRAAGIAVQAGFGIVVDAQLARSGGDVARYVTKGTAHGADAVAYASKGHGQPLPRYARAASWSVGKGTEWAAEWVRPTPLAGFTWRVADASPSVVIPALVASGFTLEDPERFRVPARR